MSASRDSTMGKMNELKVFTLKEANQLLPKLSTLIKELQEKREIILKKEVEIDTLELIDRKDESGFSPAIDKELSVYNRTVKRFYAIVDEIHEMGCFLKDVGAGLVDFYALHKGKVVYLCWKVEESKIGYWHEVGRGFDHREPLENSDEGNQ